MPNSAILQPAQAQAARIGSLRQRRPGVSFISFAAFIANIAFISLRLLRLLRLFRLSGARPRRQPV
jgi:hypothetical protein